MQDRSIDFGITVLVLIDPVGEKSESLNDVLSIHSTVQYWIF